MNVLMYEDLFFYLDQSFYRISLIILNIIDLVKPLPYLFKKTISENLESIIKLSLIFKYFLNLI